MTIIEFSDFECPYCSKGAERLKQIKDKFGKQVRVAFKHYPLPFHKKAKGAANAAMCAHEQSPAAFWQIHDLMFENQSSLDPDGIKKLAQKVKGLDMARFDQCVKDNKHAAFVEKNIEEGKRHWRQVHPHLLCQRQHYQRSPGDGSV